MWSNDGERKTPKAVDALELTRERLATIQRSLEKLGQSQCRDVANDEHVKRLTHQIQQENDPAKLLRLTRKLCRILDDAASKH